MLPGSVNCRPLRLENGVAEACVAPLKRYVGCWSLVCGPSRIIRLRQIDRSMLARTLHAQGSPETVWSCACSLLSVSSLGFVS